jgi:hypothetical protein
LPWRHFKSRKQFIAIVNSQVRGDERPARTSVRLSVISIFRSHPHERVDKAYVLTCDDIGAIGSKLIERIRRAFEFLSLHGATIETYQAGDTTHKLYLEDQFAPPKAGGFVYRALSAPPTILL